MTNFNELEARIKLAEAMWPGCVLFTNDDGEYLNLPNPFKDANDCEAIWKLFCNSEHGLGSMLISRQYDGTVEISAVHDKVRGPMQWRGEDWKYGVCELALKVISDD